MPVYSDVSYSEWLIVSTQLTFTCSKSIIKELEDDMKYDQSYFRGRNFHGQKLLRFSRFLPIFAKVSAFENSKRKNRESFFLQK